MIGGKFLLLHRDILNFSVYLPKVAWIGGEFPPDNSYVSNRGEDENYYPRS
jgi:hypothetical protein